MWIIFSTKWKSEEKKQIHTPTKTIFSTRKTPKVVWPYSKAYRAEDLLFCSGQIWVDPQSMEIVSGGIETETIQVCHNIWAVLKEYELSFKNVVKVTVFITDIANFEVVNNIYKNYFVIKPARSMVEVSALPKNALIEIEVIAKYD